MKNFKLTLEFDGTDFFGWQKQPKLRTVQGVLEEAVQEVLSEPIKVTGCGRTDAGVHAWEYVCNFHANTGLKPEQIGPAVSSRLPDDLIIKGAAEVSGDFHSRFDAAARRYQYRLTTKKTAISRRVTSYTKYSLDVDAMAAAAESLLGKQDFTSFAAAGSLVGVSPVCHVLHVRLSGQNAQVVFDVKADRFLHHMVRNIVGTLIEVGRGKIFSEQMTAILCKKDRTAAGPTAPACGLALMEISYPE